jgi:hypothetical protein
MLISAARWYPAYHYCQRVRFRGGAWPGRFTRVFRWLRSPPSRIRGLSRLRHPAWAVITTAVTFMLAYLRHAGSPTEIGAYVLGVLVLTGVAMYARIAVAARANVATAQTSWLPGMAFGLVSGIIGLPWAPLPVVRSSPESTRVHLAAPLTLVALSGSRRRGRPHRTWHHLIQPATDSAQVVKSTFPYQPRATALLLGNAAAVHSGP